MDVISSINVEKKVMVSNYMISLHSMSAKFFENKFCVS
jgi:hypothetical protein